MISFYGSSASAKLGLAISLGLGPNGPKICCQLLVGTPQSTTMRRSRKADLPLTSFNSTLNRSDALIPSEKSLRRKHRRGHLRSAEKRSKMFRRSSSRSLDSHSHELTTLSFLIPSSAERV